MCAKSQCSSIIKCLFPPPAELFPLTGMVQKQSLGHQIPAPTRGGFFLSIAARLVFKEIIIISPALPADELCGAERARLVQLLLPLQLHWGLGWGDGKSEGTVLGATMDTPSLGWCSGWEETLGSNKMLEGLERQIFRPVLPRWTHPACFSVSGSVPGVGCGGDPRQVGWFGGCTTHPRGM